MTSNDQRFQVSGNGIINQDFIADNLGVDLIENTSNFSLTFATGVVFQGIEEIDANDQDLQVVRNGTIDFSPIRQMKNVRYLQGKNGNETIIGNRGRNTFFSSSGQDVLKGKGGNDLFLVTKSQGLNDEFDGGKGQDILRNASSSILTFKNPTFKKIEEIDGNNKAIRVDQDGTVDFSSIKTMTNVAYLTGRNGTQTIIGSQDDDIFYSTNGDDLLDGQKGDDTFVIVRQQSKNDTITGGTGYDIIENRVAQPLVFAAPTIQGVEEIKGNNQDIMILSGGVVNFSDVRKMTNVRALKGDNGDEIIIGSQDDDKILGRDGNDVLEGGNGDDTINGGSGEDIAVFSGTRNNYKINDLGNGQFSVKDLRNSSPQGTDILSNIEFLEFFDTKVDLSLPLDAGSTLVAIDDSANFVNGVLSIDNGSGGKGANNGTDNVLGNDIAPTGTMSVFSVNGDSNNVGQSIPGSQGGTFTLASDGTLSFNPNGDFATLPIGTTATTDITYAVKDSDQQFIQQKNNIVFVVDVSGSTLSGFQGTSVGDLNGDGRSNTILDAEIAAFQALEDKLASFNLAPENINIGLIQFSSDGQTIGTYDPGDASLDIALRDLQGGGLTNFEAPLQQAQSWFASQGATKDDNNVVYFLSDGYPNRGGSWRDEISNMENTYDADFVAVGVGNGASLGQLATIDNTNGAEVVTTADALNASLLAGVSDDQFNTSNTATVSVNVTGSNNAPIANGDSAATKVNTSIDIDVLLNDTNINVGDVTSIINVGGATHGVTEILPNNQIRYTPNAGYIGTDSLTYTIQNSQGQSTGPVDVLIRPANTSPTANPDNSRTPQDQPVTVNVLANDSDVDGDSLSLDATLASQPSHGTARVENNEIVYTPSTGYTGRDSLQYTVLDGQGGQSVATLTIDVDRVDLVGDLA